MASQGPNNPSSFNNVIWYPQYYTVSVLWANMSSSFMNSDGKIWILNDGGKIPIRNI